MSDELDALAAQTDEVVSLVRRGVLTCLEGTGRVAVIAIDAIRFTLVDNDEAALAVDYARAAASAVASLTGVVDRPMLAHFEQLLDVGVETSGLLGRLELDLADLEARYECGDADAASEVEGI